MAEQTSTGYFQNPYKFNGKELDEETGLYYYGARYYDPRGSLWLSVDPLMEKYPSITPFMYTAGNPVMFLDPDGSDIKIYYLVQDKSGKAVGYKNWCFNGKNFNQAPNVKFVDLVLAAYKYNTRNGGGESMQKAATNSSVSIPILESKDGNSWGGVEMKNKRGDWVEMAVLFNPNSGSMTSDGYELSPATNLDEEFDHALNYIDDRKGNWDRYREFDKDYDNKEERRAKQEGTVRKTAIKNGEVPKNWKGEKDHHAKPVRKENWNYKKVKQ